VRIGELFYSRVLCAEFALAMYCTTLVRLEINRGFSSECIKHRDLSPLLMIATVEYMEESRVKVDNQISHHRS
jgi:hypothetical protein